MIKFITIIGVIVGIVVGAISILQAVQGQPNPFLEMTRAVIDLTKVLSELANRCLAECFEGN